MSQDIPEDEETGTKRRETELARAVMGYLGHYPQAIIPLQCGVAGRALPRFIWNCGGALWTVHVRHYADQIMLQ
jgi:hypothetical protein